ncbi:unnamed protein product [Cuscuta europaea]|uniref:Uncharacterized protein n=1 Tax=Cuscuta europaea TaxID=41803 RepID=A0A9P1EFI3_CUSEU|nr:unnamed protein product [Cuscuta europaea]
MLITDDSVTQEIRCITWSTSGARDVMLREGVKSVADGPLEDDCLHVSAELVLKISGKNRQHVLREQELLKLLSEERAAHKRVIEAHKAREAHERDAHAAELIKVRAEREDYIDSHLKEIAERWLKTPAGIDRLDKDGLLCYNLGEYTKQQEIYVVLRAQHGASCIADWGLPFEIPNPEPENVDPSSRVVPSGDSITSEEVAMLGFLA